MTDDNEKHQCLSFLTSTSHTLQKLKNDEKRQKT